MPRHSITGLPRPPARFRIDRPQKKARKRRLDAFAAPTAEAELRLGRLQKAANPQTKKKMVQRRRNLATLLRRHLASDQPCESAACPLCMHEQRIPIVGALWQLVEDPQWGQPVTATLIPRGMKAHGGSLKRFSAKKLKQRLLSDLNRCGAAKANGYVFAALHGEFEPNSQTYQLHWHTVACGEMVAVLDRLRKRPKYLSRKDDASGVRQRVRIGRKKLNRLPDPLTYLLQSWWPCRWIGNVDGGEIKRQRRRHRIPEPFHTEYLLWLHDQPLEDLILLRKL